MRESNPDGSPLERAAGSAGPRAIDAFSLLGSETRLAIMLALWEAYDPWTDRNAVTFSALRNRVGIRQGSQFNYHLDKLVGTFVRKTDDGYELRRTGRIFVQSIIAGIGIEEPSVEPTVIDAPCKFCGAPTQIRYENAYVYQVCTSCPGEVDPGSDHPPGALVGWTFEPTGLSDRTATEVFAASTVKNFTRIATRFEGICPVCAGPVDWELDLCEQHDPGPDGTCPACERKRAVFAREVCTVCKSSGVGTPGIKVLFHPAVVAFYYDHGIEVGFTGDTDFADAVRTLALVEEFEEVVESVSPPRVRVILSRDDDELHLILDEDMNVVEVDRRS